MNDRRLARLKRLAAGAALVTATLTYAGDPPKPNKPHVNSPPDPEPVEPKPGPPIYMNSPGPQQPVAVDAGVKAVEETPKPVKLPKPPNVNSPPPKQK